MLASQFKKIFQISRIDVTKSKPKTNEVSKIEFVIKCNLVLPKIDVLSKSTFKFYTVTMHSELCFRRIALVIFIKEIKI